MPLPEEYTGVPNFYINRVSDADAARFSSSESGQELIINKNQLTVIGGVPFAYQLPSNMHYQVGKHQIIVQSMDAAGASNELLNYLTWAAALPAPVVPTAYFKEINSSVIQVILPGGAPTYIRFFIPHTATPGVFASKVVVADQGDKIGIELLGNGVGIKTKTISGNSVVLRVSDEETLIISQA